MIIKSCILAYKDYIHESLLSLCAILSLASILTPLLVLYGVKYGIINTMTERLQNNPHNLEIIPISSGHYTQSWITEMSKNSHVGFILPKTRSISSTMTLILYGEKNILKNVHVSLEPTAQYDILLSPYNQDNIKIKQNKKQPQDSFEITLSAEAARKLKAIKYSLLQGRVERLNNGKVQRAQVKLWVQNILPLEIQQKDVAFIPLSLLEATEDFRDGRKPLHDRRLKEENGWTGEQLPNIERIYPSFRLYAKNLDSVSNLRDYFAKHSIEVYTKAEEIAAVRNLNASLNLIFILISSAAGIGFMASNASNALASVRRKERYIGILQQMGFKNQYLIIFPLFQSFLTTGLGTILAIIFYLISSKVINYLFASHRQNDLENICFLPINYIVIGFSAVLLLSLLSTLIPATSVKKVIPSEVIRDI